MRHSFILIMPILFAFLPIISHAETAELVTLKYDEKGKIEIKDTSYSIPTYLPYLEKGYGKQSDPIYTTYNATTLSEDKLRVEFGLSEKCFGENFCSFATYSSEKISEHLQSVLIETMEAYAKKVELVTNLDGYYVPSKCYAYCNESKLFWFMGEKIYMIGTTFGGEDKVNIVELRKAANSVIESPKEKSPDPVTSSGTGGT